MLVSDFLEFLDRVAPLSLAQPEDNCGLLVGDLQNQVSKVLVALEITGPVLDEAVRTNSDTVLTHHPVLFSPIRSLVEHRRLESVLRRTVREGLTVIALHTNLDAADGGLADIVAGALELEELVPLERASAQWYRFVGFLPVDHVEAVSAAVFAAGAGRIGNYEGCAFASVGEGWFVPGEGAQPFVGQVATPERVAEVRWETVVPKRLLPKVVSAYVAAHPYEEPAFDIYPVEDVLARCGLGRVGRLREPATLEELAARVAEVFACDRVSWCGSDKVRISRVGVVPGSGRSLIEAAASCCEVLVTGDLGHHDPDRALSRGLALINVPHGELEWWAFRRWVSNLLPDLKKRGVTVVLSETYDTPWRAVPQKERERADHSAGQEQHRTESLARQVLKARAWIDGGSRGNPGPAAIGVVIEDEDGRELDRLSTTIGVTTNNVAEYRALLAALAAAERLGVRSMHVFSDSELLVKQLRGEYRVHSEALRPLHDEVQRRVACLESWDITHVPREQNARADALVNEALDESAHAGL